MELWGVLQARTTIDVLTRNKANPGLIDQNGRPLTITTVGRLIIEEDTLLI